MRGILIATLIGCVGTTESGTTEEDSSTTATDSSTTPVDSAMPEVTLEDTGSATTETSVVDAPPMETAVDPCVGRLVCDDFEKSVGKPGAPFNLSTNKGSIAIDTTRAFSGKQSVKITVDATTSSDTYRRAFLTLKGAPLLPIANNTVYGRFMIWTDRIPDKSVHWTFAHGDGPVGSGLTATYNYGGMGGLMANYYKNSTPNPTDCWQTKTQTFPTSKWTCVAFQLDGKNSEMRFWLDGTEIPELHVVGMSKTDATCTVKGVDGKWYAPNPFQNISVGWESYQHDVAGAHTAWIDDVILDDAPIACP
jgi:hypothetical protein